jgi:hypothetical protein
MVVIEIGTKSKQISRGRHVVLFIYISLNVVSTKVACFSNICYPPKFQDTKLSGGCVASSLKVSHNRCFHIIDYRTWRLVGSQLHDANAKF